jgi:hypothetical protein
MRKPTGTVLTLLVYVAGVAAEVAVAAVPGVTVIVK